MIFAGVALLHTLHWVVYVFGAILILGGIKMWRSHGVKIDPRKNPILRLVRRVLPVAHGDHGPRFFTRENGALAACINYISRNCRKRTTAKRTRSAIEAARLEQ